MTKTLDNFNNLHEMKILNNVIEPFDGIRKNNARKIFGILLLIIIVDFAMDIMVWVTMRDMGDMGDMGDMDNISNAS